MDTRFGTHFQSWLPAVLRQKALATAVEGEPALIGAADLSTMLCDYILQTLSEEPRSCLDCCGLDDVAEQEIVDAAGFDRDAMAAGFIGAVVELTVWGGAEGVALLIGHGVPEEDAIEFAHAVEVVSEKLAARGQSLVIELSGRPTELTATA